MSYVDNDEPLKWGLEVDRIAVPMVLFCRPDMVQAFRDRGVASCVSIVPAELSEPVAADEKLARLSEVCRNGTGPVDHYYWVDIDLIYRHLSFEFLYSDVIVRAVRPFTTRSTYFTMPGYDASSFFGGPKAVLQDTHARRDSISSSMFEDQPAPTDPPAVFSAAFGYGSGVDLNFKLAGVIEEPILHVAGDSHVFNCFTPNRAVGCRTNVLVRTRDVSAIRVPYAYQFTHHLGGRTMHHAGQPGALLAMAAQFGLRAGDGVAWVFGEIDVRSHVLRQCSEADRAPDEVVTTLARNYVRSILEIKREYPHVRNVVFAPIPPLDNPDYQSVDLPVHGSIEERIAVTRQLRVVLETLCARHGILFLDVAEHFETERGDLRWELSDRFCHIANTYQGPILEGLYRLFGGGGGES